MKLITDDLFGLYDERKFFSITTNSQRTLSCLKQTTLMECNFTGS